MKFHFYFNASLEFPHALFTIPPKTQCLQLNPPVWVFSGIAQFTFPYKLINHNLQRMIFRIFSYLSTKLISNKVKDNKTCLNGVIQLSSSSTDTDRDKYLLEIKSTFSFFSRCFSRSFLHNQISCLSWCISSLSVSLISAAGFHDSSASQSLCGIWLDIFSKMLWFILYILIKLQFLPFQNTIKKNWKDEQGYNSLSSVTILHLISHSLTLC